MMDRPQVRSYRSLALAARTLILLFVAALSLFVGSEVHGQSNRDGRLDWRLEQLVSEFEAGRPPAATEVHGVEIDHGLARVIVEALPTGAEQAAEDARASGGRVEASYGSLLQLDVPIVELRNLATSPGVMLVRPPLKAYTTTITGEGVALTNANAWQTAGLTGAGVKVAILDLGFQGYEAKLGGELPASVTAMSFVAGGDIHGGTVHGTAVAEIVHEMAPDAQMYLANFSTEVELANAASWLHDQGVRAVNASWGYFTSGPGDGTGIVDQIITDSVNSGVFWSVAAGNHAARHWSGQFVDTDNNSFHEFSASPFDEGNELAGSFFGYMFPGEQVAAELKWNDPFGAACRDYDLYLERTDENGNPLLIASSQEVQNDGTQCIPNADPVEELTFTIVVADIYHLVIKKMAAASDATLDLYSAYHDLEYETPANSLMQPGDNPAVTTVGAVPYYSPSTIEPFSSLGPTTDNRVKPDIAGPDGVSNSSIGNFFGTSAATPHVTGAAALVLGILPCLTPSQTGSFLESQVVDLGSPGKDTTYGSGRLSLGQTPVDADTDGVGLACDNCPNWSNLSQALPNWPVPNGDSDCDGFPDSVAIGPPDSLAAEAGMGTDAASHCAADSTSNNEGLPDRWPVDFDDNQLANGSDLLTFATVFGGIAPSAPYDARWDLNADGRVSGSDFLKLAPFFGKTCA